MRILWYSATPECSSGYGNATRNMVQWLRRQGHFVAVATKHAMTMSFQVWDFGQSELIIKRALAALKLGDQKTAMDFLEKYETIYVVEGTNIDVLNRAVIDKWKIDVCISMFDTWTLKTPLHRHIAWIPVDTDIANEKLIKVTKDLPMQIAMTHHGKAELEKGGLKPEYAPIGYDHSIFFPKLAQGRDFRRSLVFPNHPIDPDDMFLIGSVGINYPDDRKGFIRLMQAFKHFHEKHDEARLYLHTVAHKRDNGQNYAGIAMQLGIDNLITWPDQDRMYYEGYDENIISEIYSGFDVFCLSTKGEGFGMPVVEAQACGVPVVVSDNTSMPQLCKTGWLIERHWDDAEYLGSNVWRYPPKPRAILDALEKAYQAERPDEAAKQRISDSISEYRWENVWKSYWTPIIDKIEGLAASGSLDIGEK